MLDAEWVTVAAPLQVRITAIESESQYQTQYQTQRTITITRSNDAVPIAQQSTPIQVVGLQDGVAQDVVVSFPACSTINVTQVTLAYNWRLFNAANEVEVDMTTLPNLAGRTTSQVSFGTSTLNYGSYLLRAYVTYASSTVQSNSLIQIVAGDLTANVNGGNYQVVTVSQANTLSVTITDPDSTEARPRTYVISWLACAIDGTACTVQANTATFVVPANTIPSGQGAVYVVLVTDANNANRIAVDGVYLEGTTVVVPKLKPGRFPETPTVSAKDDTIVWVDAFDASTNDEIFGDSYQWSISPRSAVTNVQLTGPTTDPFYIAPAGLFAAGADVTLRCTVTVGSASVSADIRVQFAGLPAGGSLRVLNENTNLANGVGQAFAHTFRLSTTGWNGGAQPYGYSFGFTTSVNNEEEDNFLSFLSSSSSVTGVRFPATATKAWVILTDNVGTEVRVNQTLTITRPTGQTVAQVITAANTQVSTIRATISSSSEAALLQIGALLDFIDFDALPATPSASERAQIIAMQNQANAWLNQIATSRGTVDAGFAARSASMLTNIDLGAVSSDATQLTNTLNLLTSTINGAAVGKGGKAVSADPKVTGQMAGVVDDLLDRTFASQPTTLRRRDDAHSPLRRRQVNTETQLRSSVAGLLQGSVAGDTCRSSGVARTVTSRTGSFLGNVRRISPTANTSGDSARTVGNFVATLPAVGLPAGSCLDSHMVQWRQARNSQVASNKIVSRGVLSVNTYNSGSTTAGPNVSSRLIRYVSNNLLALPANHRADCVQFSGNAWTSTGCTTVSRSGTSVTCDCPLSSSDFAVQAVPVTTGTTTTTSGTTTATGTGTGTPTPTPPAEGGSNAGAIAGGVVGGVVGVGAIGGGLAYMRKRRAG
ncbi:hypothetical protein BCR44DRAFT_1223408 [Catenaria anguillulae PL171]|uniref:GPS domain-containing protein n=1 Tax=Catenaria anguillulae PL171 TaxID=765915 RepID=A0A1Y2HEM8_9FUNG|nr:hypothetical protein BCR44DRAFT_1223408 [Catenaria anguillulae PL171]